MMTAGTKPRAESGGGGSGTEQRVPVEALAMPGEDEQLNNPEVGDPVSYQVEGKVAALEGDQAVVTVATVNGKPVTAEAAKTADETEAGEAETAGEREALYGMARERMM